MSSAPAVARALKIMTEPDRWTEGFKAPSPLAIQEQNDP